MRKISFLLITALFVIFFCAYELIQGYNNFNSESLFKAKDITTVILAVRKWNFAVGDFYAPSSHVVPNPYLDKENRDIKVIDIELTRVNSAYLTRMISEILTESSNISVRMISTTPLNPINTPSKWEEKALKFIEKKQTDYSKMDYSDLSNIQFNYMQPIYIEKDCLSCHDYQKYKQGDVIGGISVSFPVTQEHNKTFLATIFKIFAYLVSAILVIYIVLNSRKKLMKAYQEKLDTIKELEVEISRREKSEAALIMQTRSSSTSQVLSLIAHHWRQPLNNIGLLVQSIKEDATDNQTKESSNSALSIIKEMSETIDLFTSTVRPNKTKHLEIKDMVFDVLKLLKPELETSNIEAFIFCTIGGEIESPASTDTDHVYHSCGLGNLKCEKQCGFSDLHIFGEEAMFKQILFALLKNAYDALLLVSKEEKRAITITFEKQGDYALIKICDNGAPITEEVKTKLFEPYFSTKGIEAGRGIGLFSAKSLAQNFDDAHLYYDDSNGKCFIFKFRTCT